MSEITLTNDDYARLLEEAKKEYVKASKEADKDLQNALESVANLAKHLEEKGIRV